MRITVLVATIVFLLDQISKYVVLHIMRLDQVRVIDVLPPWLNFHMAWNQGVNFGLMAGDSDWIRWAIIALSLVIAVWIWVWISRSHRDSVWMQVAGGLLIGGALGNVIDRILYGAVADFLNMSLPFWQNPFSFNVADISIFCGAIGLVFSSGESTPRAKRRQ